MAEKKQKRIVSADTGKDVTKKARTKVSGKGATPTGSTGGLRFGAIFLWVLAIACEVMALMVLWGKISIGSIPMLYSLIGFLVLDLIFVVIGSQLWKKANHIKPASEKNKFTFWLWNNLGFIVSVIAFMPIIILILVNKDADKKTKAIATAVAVVALAVGGLTGIDWNPLSQEDVIEASEKVYWTEKGAKYHTRQDCPSLNKSEELFLGTIEEAQSADKEWKVKDGLCSFCEKHDAKALEGEESNTIKLEDIVDSIEEELPIAN